MKPFLLAATLIASLWTCPLRADAPTPTFASAGTTQVPASARALMPRGATSLFAVNTSRAFGRPALLHVWAVNNPISARYSQADVLVPASKRRAASYKRLQSFKLPWIYPAEDDKGGPPSDLEVRSAYLNARTKRGPVIVLQYRQTFDHFTQVLTFPNGLNGRGYLQSLKDEGSPDGGVTYVPDLDARGNFGLRADVEELGKKTTRRFRWTGRDYED